MDDQFIFQEKCRDREHKKESFQNLTSPEIVIEDPYPRFVDGVLRNIRRINTDTYMVNETGEKIPVGSERIKLPIMKYFLGTEFHEYKKNPLFGKGIDTIELISIGIVAEDGREYYAISKDFDLKAAWDSFKYRIYFIFEDYQPGYDSVHKDYRLKDKVLKSIFEDLSFKAAEDKDFPIKHIGEFSYKKLKKLIDYYGKTNRQIAKEIIDFINPDQGNFPTYIYVKEHNIDVKYPRTDTFGYAQPEFYGYYCDYDWVVFCWLFGRMNDLPKGFPRYCKDLKQELDATATGIDGFTFEQSLNAIKNDPNYPKQANEHNALAHAKWTYELYKFLKSI